MQILQIHDFSSAVFRNNRKLRVWLPPGYELAENAERRYPIFYLNDGQNLFDPATAYAGVDWRAGETADALMQQGIIEPMILVGIDNATVERIKEFMPHHSVSPLLLKPRGRRYPDFLLREVMPFVESRYRVARGPENTGLGGSSLGAIISLYTAMAMPGVFGKLLLESPSLFVSNRQLLKNSRRLLVWPERIFLAIGTRESGNEGRDQRLVKDARTLEFILRRKGLTADRLRVVLGEGAGHNESAWAHRFPEALSFLFRKQAEVR